MQKIIGESSWQNFHKGVMGAGLGSGVTWKPHLLPWGMLKLGSSFKDVSPSRQWGWVIVPPGKGPHSGKTVSSLQLRAIPRRAAYTAHTTPDPRGVRLARTEHCWPPEG